jgi:hypothetical protein
VAPNKPTGRNIPLRDHDHIFLKGYRIMVQIQSTCFSVIGHKPQIFVPGIYPSIASDFVPATTGINCSAAMTAHALILLLLSPDWTMIAGAGQLDRLVIGSFTSSPNLPSVITLWEAPVLASRQRQGAATRPTEFVYSGRAFEMRDSAPKNIRYSR